jgi:hypothetical protein
MSYDNPIRREVYYLPSGTYGATTVSKIFNGPPGKRGTVRDILMIPTADNVGTTTVPEITVGSGAGLVEYARFRLGTTAILGYTSAAGPRRAASLAKNAPGRTGSSPPTLNDFAGHVALETAKIPADTNFTISGKAGVGGVPAGTFEAYITIDWD